MNKPLWMLAAFVVTSVVPLAPAHARDNVRIGIGLNFGGPAYYPGHYHSYPHYHAYYAQPYAYPYYGPPVYVVPQPAYVQPYPVYLPQPVYAPQANFAPQPSYAPQPNYAPAPTGYEHNGNGQRYDKYGAIPASVNQPQWQTPATLPNDGPRSTFTPLPAPSSPSTPPSGPPIPSR